MIIPEILDYKDVLTEEMRKPANWIIAYIEPSMAWPARVQRIVYFGQEFLILPVTNDAYPAVAVKACGANDDELRERILRFLSVLSWIKDGGASVVSFGGGSHLLAHLRPKGGGLMICNEIDLRYLPRVSAPKARLALALMREGRSLKHIAYSFLTFWRVMEVAVGKNEIMDWIAKAIPRLTEARAKEAIGKIQDGDEKIISEHLYVSGRCAIAHAGSEPIVDPDQPKDTWRLAQEMPLVEALAVLAIEEVLGVQTSSTIYREHLYELGGFKRIFGENVVRNALDRVATPDLSDVDVPIVDIGLMSREPFQALQALRLSSMAHENGMIQLQFSRGDGRLQVQLGLNFEEERLEFDIFNAVFGTPDDGSATWADIKADANDFMKWYFLNGCLTVSDSETGELIARKDEFVPVNVTVDPDAFDDEAAKWRNIANERRISGQDDPQV